jgi:hypothetical protein
VSISQTGRPTDDTFKCQAAHRGVDEPTDDPASRVNQGTELREEFEERPLRGAKSEFEHRAAVNPGLTGILHSYSNRIASLGIRRPIR